MSPFRADFTVPKPPCKYCHPERRVVACEVCINPRFLTPHRNIPRGRNDRVPQAETEYFQGLSWRVVACEVCINPRFLTPHRNIPRGLNDRVPQAETEYFQGVKDLRIGSHILPFKPILLHGSFGCVEILRLRAKPFAQDDTLIIFVHRRMSSNAVRTGDS